MKKMAVFLLIIATVFMLPVTSAGASSIEDNTGIAEQTQEFASDPGHPEEISYFKDTAEADSRDSGESVEQGDQSEGVDPAGEPEEIINTEDPDWSGDEAVVLDTGEVPVPDEREKIDEVAAVPEQAAAADASDGAAPAGETVTSATVTPDLPVTGENDILIWACTGLIMMGAGLFLIWAQSTNRSN